jgi:hypothetical protein
MIGTPKNRSRSNMSWIVVLIIAVGGNDGCVKRANEIENGQLCACALTPVMS